MSSGRRTSTPEWFGGIALERKVPSAENSNGGEGNKKKKHRRSKSDTTYQKSNSRKASERKSKKSKDGKHGKGREGLPSLKEADIHEYSKSLADSSRQQTGIPLTMMPGFAMGSEHSSNTGLGGEGPKSKEDSKQSPKRQREAKVKHSTDKKSGFMERLFSLGRTSVSTSTSPPPLSPEPTPMHVSVAPTSSASSSLSLTSVHLHVHNKIEEKFDIEEMRPLSGSFPEGFAPPPTAAAHPNPSYPLPKIENRAASPLHHLSSYQRPIPSVDQGTDSDEFMTYSDDETAASFHQQLQLKNKNMMYPVQEPPPMFQNDLYPSYSSNNDFLVKHESYQIREHQQMMAMSTQNQVDGETNNINMKQYGSINAPTQVIPPRNIIQQQIHQASNVPQQNYYYQPQPPQQQERFNDMYLSEDETTLNSVHTQETYKNLDNFYFERRRPNERISPLHPELGAAIENSKLQSDNSDSNLSGLGESLNMNQTNILELDLDLDATNHVHNRSRSFRDIETDEQQEHEHQDEGKGHQHHESAETSTMSEYLKSTKGSKGSSTHHSSVEDNISSSSSSSLLITPPAHSHSSHSRSERRRNSASQLQPKPSHPPPPIASVQIFTKQLSSGTSGTGTSSVLHQSYSSSSNLSQHRGRKEYKRLRKRIELAEAKEELIQFIIHDIRNPLEWSQHPPQNVRGVNYSAGFFPPTDGKMRDFIFLVLFVIQLSIVIFLATRYAGETMLSTTTTSNNSYNEERDPFHSVESDDPFSSVSTLPEDSSSPLSVWTKDIYVDYTNAVQLACITALYATSLSALAIGMMMILSNALIPTVLCGTVVFFVVVGSIGAALSPYNSVPVLSIAALTFSLGYCIVVWDRIPFATTNLNVALVGMKSSADVLLVGFAMMIVAFVWTIVSTIAFLGVYDHFLDKDSEEGFSNSYTWLGISVYMGLFISYIWTLNVIMNVVHVTVAGVVGSWWSTPEYYTSCCTNVCRGHFGRAITESFGSICFGSLVVPPLSWLQNIAHMCSHYNIKPQPISIPISEHSSHDVGSMMGDKSVKSDMSAASFFPQPSSSFDDVVRYFNDFGFTHIALYREGFVSSSEKATEVFKARSWLGIVTDPIIPHVLTIISLFITLSSGCFGLVVEEFDGYSFTNFKKPTSTAFLIGCCIGMVLSSVCLKVVASSVNTVLVCFSTAPYAFKYYHPVLSNEMRASWGGIWLDELVQVENTF
mmetsp:Transcript_25416/g.29437  ORF Transcript_25416/g.29437 Transcript_25416/m.29437 type:complete len:1213 (-) Transcript_25416:136-3774(-)